MRVFNNPTLIFEDLSGCKHMNSIMLPMNWACMKHAILGIISQIVIIENVYPSRYRGSGLDNYEQVWPSFYSMRYANTTERFM